LLLDDGLSARREVGAGSLEELKAHRTKHCYHGPEFSELGQVVFSRRLRLSRVHLARRYLRCERVRAFVPPADPTTWRQIQ
jgi:hypothetical protein